MKEEGTAGTSVVVQWLGLHASKARALSWIPGEGSRSHMAQLRLGAAKLIN